MDKVREKERAEDTQAKCRYIVLPYLKCLPERLKRIYQKHNITLHSKPKYTLRDTLVAPKDKLTTDEKHGVVHSVKCSDCDDEYRRA